MFYLYLKTHNVTGLKYVGYTSRSPQTYRGSGKHWVRHINKHGYDVTTIVLYETSYMEEIKEIGLYFSELWNIVESKEFANMKQEDGTGGGGFSKEVIDKIIKGCTGLKRSDATKQKMSESFKGRKFTDKHKQKLRENRNNCLDNNKGLHPWKNKKLKDVMETEEYNRYISNLKQKSIKYGENNNFFGKKHSDDTKNRISNTKTNVYLLDNKIIAFGVIDKEKAKKLYNTSTEQILCKKREFINNNIWIIYNQ